MKEAKLDINQATTIISILYINNAFFGFIKEKTILNVLCLLCMVLWIVLASQEEGFLQNCFSTCTPLIIYTVFLIVLFFFSGANMDSDLWTNLRNAFFSLICSFLCLYILPQDETYKHNVFVFLLINILLGSVYTFYRIQENPLLPRLLAMGSKSIAGNARTAGVITYGGIYGMALVFPSLLYWISQKQGQKKLVPIIITVILIVIIYKAQFAIAVFSTIAGIVLYLILYNGQSQYRYIVSGLFVVIVLIVMFNWDSILNAVYSANILPSALQQKAHELLLYSENSNLSGTNLYSRSTYYVRTFEAIVKNNFIGKVFSDNARGYGHSEWEDMAANYGIIAPILVCVFFHKFTKRISGYLKGNTIIVYRIQLFIFLIIGFVDPIFHSRTMSYLMLLSPLILTMYEVENKTTDSRSQNQNGAYLKNKPRYIR